jgi:hypothetical protein
MSTARAFKLCEEWQRALGRSVAVDEQSAFISGVNAADAWVDKYTLPCDVILQPNTILRKGVRLATLIAGLIGREKVAD